MSKPTSFPCSSCGVNLKSTWCVNQECERYIGQLHKCAVKDCLAKTPHLMCRTHFKDDRCRNCAEVHHDWTFEGQGICRTCTATVGCAHPECKREMIVYGKGRPHKFCGEHFRMYCRDCETKLVNKVCPSCSPAQQCQNFWEERVKDKNGRTSMQKKYCKGQTTRGRYCKECYDSMNRYVVLRHEE